MEVPLVGERLGTFYPGRFDSGDQGTVEPFRFGFFAVVPSPWRLLLRLLLPLLRLLLLLLSLLLLPLLGFNFCEPFMSQDYPRRFDRRLHLGGRIQYFIWVYQQHACPVFPPL